MDMHRCLPSLHKTGMGAGKAAEELERDRPLVIGARIWLAVSLLAPTSVSNAKDTDDPADQTLV